MTTKHTFVFRSSDPNVISYMETKNVAEYLRDLVKRDMAGGLGKITLKDEKTRQEILSLKIKNRLALIQELKLAPSLAIEVSEGRMALEVAYEKQFGEKLPEGLTTPQEEPPEWEHFCKGAGRKIIFSRKSNPRCHLCSEEAP